VLAGARQQREGPGHRCGPPGGGAGDVTCRRRLSSRHRALVPAPSGLGSPPMIRPSEGQLPPDRTPCRSGRGGDRRRRTARRVSRPYQRPGGCPGTPPTPTTGKPARACPRHFKLARLRDGPAQDPIYCAPLSSPLTTADVVGEQVAEQARAEVARESPL